MGCRNYIIATMKFRQLADTGVFVSELCLGAMTFGGRGQMWEVIGERRAAGVMRLARVRHLVSNEL